MDESVLKEWNICRITGNYSKITANVKDSSYKKGNTAASSKQETNTVALLQGNT